MDRKPPPKEPPRALPLLPDLYGLIDAGMRRGAPATYAGLCIAHDEAILVRVTVEEPVMHEIVSEAQREALRTRPESPDRRPVRILAGHAYSLTQLEQVRDAITARHDDLKAQGIHVTGWGADVNRNRVKVDVNGLTAEGRALLEREFGAEILDIIDKPGGWFGYVALDGA